MPNREELVELDLELKQRQLEIFEKQFITTKGKLLCRIDMVIKTINDQIDRLNNDDVEMLSYLKSKSVFVDRFRNAVDSTPLFDRLEAWWAYSFELGSSGAELRLWHTCEVDICGEEPSKSLFIVGKDSEFTLLDIKPRFLSAEEFAKVRHVASSTIRVWIRRGKIRSAIKLGNTWKISELAAPVTRGFSEASYSWGSYLENLPSGFEWLSSPGSVGFRQDNQNKQQYEALYFLSEHNPKLGKVTLSSNDLAKLEAYLIANPIVTYDGDTEFYE